MGSLPQTTFLRAMRKHPQLFATFSGLMYELIRKHLPLSTATLKGHMIHQRQGLDSTGNMRQELEGAQRIVSDMTPTEHVFHTRGRNILFCCDRGQEQKTLSTVTSRANFQSDHMTAWYIFLLRMFINVSLLYVTK